MKKLLVKWPFAILTSVLIIFLCGPTLALPILDQSQTQSDGSIAFWGDRPLVQTFTAGITGTLDTVSLLLGAVNESAPIHIAITTWVSSYPQTTLALINTTLSPSQLTWMDFDFLSQNVSLSAGGMYGIMLSNDLSYNPPPDPYQNTGIGVQWDTNPYSGGGLWGYYSGSWVSVTNTDAAFQTSISDGAPVPEPTTMLLLGTSLVGLAGFGRKKFFKK